MSFPHRGDLYWVNLDPTIGSEIKKTRPCVVISPDAANQAGPLVIVVPVSKARGKRPSFTRSSFPKAPPDSLLTQRLRCSNSDVWTRDA